MHADPLQRELAQATLQRLYGPDIACFSLQALASIMYSSAKLPTAKPSVNVLDSLCSCFLPKVELANAEDVTDFVYCLQGLRHLPSGIFRHTMALAMVCRMLQLCGVEGRQPSSQHITNFLVVCAQLRLGVSEKDVKKLAAHQLSIGQTIERADYRSLGSYSLEPGCDAHSQ